MSSGRAVGQDRLLELSDVWAGYGSIQVLHGVSIHVRSGELVALIGANGAGKSTVLRVVAGLLAPRRGEVRLAGVAIQGTPAYETTRKGLALVPQRGRVFTELTVAENLELGALVCRLGRRELRERMGAVLALFPSLQEKRGRLAGALSGGEQQMVAIARALMARPRLLMLDEPSLGLAPKVVAEVFERLRLLHSSGATILMVEQNALAALSIADRGYVLENGHVALEGSAEDLLHDDYVRKAYLAA